MPLREVAARRMPGVVRHVREAKAVVLDALPRRRAPGARSVSVPVLLYHTVDDVPGEVTPRAFRAHVAAIHGEGWRSITMTALADAFARGEVPQRTVAINVDDGLRDVVRTIVPTLALFGFTCTAYVVPGRVGNGRHMSWSELAEIQAAGSEVGNHTMEHPRLAELPTDQVDWQIREADRLLRSELPAPPETMAFPHGSADARSVHVVRELGYRMARMTTLGCATPGGDPLQVPIVLSVKGRDSTAAVLRSLRRCEP
jgi:peptidoglycan/xylan/chitin deacetylase (PgdA/CDA1 family)